MKPLLWPIALVLGLSLVAPPGHAIRDFTSLDGMNQSPHNPSHHSGVASLDYELAAGLLSAGVSFSGMLRPAIATHFHCCTSGFRTGISIGMPAAPAFTGFPLSVLNGSFFRSFDSTLGASVNPAFIAAHGGMLAGAEADLLGGVLSGKSYRNISSSAYLGGEERGLWSVIPEPGTLGLLALGLTGLGAVWRRAKGSTA